MFALLVLLVLVLVLAPPPLLVPLLILRPTQAEEALPRAGTAVLVDVILSELEGHFVTGDVSQQAGPAGPAGSPNRPGWEPGPESHQLARVGVIDPEPVQQVETEAAGVGQVGERRMPPVHHPRGGACCGGGAPRRGYGPAVGGGPLLALPLGRRPPLGLPDLGLEDHGLALRKVRRGTGSTGQEREAEAAATEKRKNGGGRRIGEICWSERDSKGRRSRLPSHAQAELPEMAAMASTACTHCPRYGGIVSSV